MPNVLITGSSSGIGLATALRLARAGHKVFATMRNTAKGAELAATAKRESLPLEIHHLDVDSDSSVAEAFDAISDPIDVLVNNAGIEVHGAVEEMPMKEFVAVMNTNYFGLLRCTKAVLPQMRERRDGLIINISSVAGKISSSPLGAYSASKHAVEAISEALAGELKPFNVRVAIVEPGIQDTGMAQAISNHSESAYRQPNRFGGLFRAALAHPISPDASAVVIENIIADGGWKLRHPAGADAEPFLAWRAARTDEQWVDWNALSDEDWYAAVAAEFGLDARV